MSTTKKEDYLFDNYKLLLITLVVIGHFLQPNYKNNEFLYNLKWMIYSFHVPAFVFVSGYFSKRTKTFWQLIRADFIPYLVFEVLYYFYYIYILHRSTGLYLLYPKFSLWYLICIFAWRLITPYFTKIPGHMIISVALGLLIGLSDIKDNFLSLPRILVFYPFFLLGYHITRGHVAGIRQKLRKVKSVIITVFCFVLVYLIANYSDFHVKMFYGRYNYDFLKQTPLSGMLYRLLFYALGGILTFTFLCLVSEKKLWVTRWGFDTLPIYIGHGFVYNYFKDQTPWLANAGSISDMFLLLGLCLLLVVVFAQPPFHRLMDIIDGKRALHR